MPTLDDMLRDLELGEGWSSWEPLHSLVWPRSEPVAQGLYRVRRIGTSGLDYLGESGRLRGRLTQDLRVLYRDEIPLEAPHTAAAALWIVRTQDSAAFEVSHFLTPGLSPRERKGIEAVATLLARLESGESPSFCFHRMPGGWTRSRRTRDDAARFVGGTLSGPSLPPLAALGDVVDLDWCGLAWSPWSSLSGKTPHPGPGLYRIRRSSADIAYIGQSGNLASRLGQHAGAWRNRGTKLGLLLTDDEAVECSWVEGPWDGCQREELEYDLIGHYVRSRRSIPAGQFLSSV